MELDKLIQLFHNAGYNPRSYSGRGMRGRECIGVVVTDANLFSFGTSLAVHAASMDIDVVHELSQLKPKVDSLGRDMIVYFPDMEWPSEL